MKPYNEREAEAKAYTAACTAKRSNETPEGQKFSVGDVVYIAKDLGESMSHFTKDCEAIVEYSYAQQYGGNDVKSYCLSINGNSTSWYYEHQLTLVNTDVIVGSQYDRKIVSKLNNRLFITARKIMENSSGTKQSLYHIGWSDLSEFIDWLEQHYVLKEKR